MKNLWIALLGALLTFNAVTAQSDGLNATERGQKGTKSFNIFRQIFNNLPFFLFQVSLSSKLSGLLKA